MLVSKYVYYTNLVMVLNTDTYEVSYVSRHDISILSNFCEGLMAEACYLEVYYDTGLVSYNNSPKNYKLGSNGGVYRDYYKRTDNIIDTTGNLMDDLELISFINDIQFTAKKVKEIIEDINYYFNESTKSISTNKLTPKLPNSKIITKAVLKEKYTSLAGYCYAGCGLLVRPLLGLCSGNMSSDVVHKTEITAKLDEVYFPDCSWDGYVVISPTGEQYNYEDYYYRLDEDSNPNMKFAKTMMTIGGVSDDLTKYELFPLKDGVNIPENLTHYTYYREAAFIRVVNTFTKDYIRVNKNNDGDCIFIDSKTLTPYDEGNHDFYYYSTNINSANRYAFSELNAQGANTLILIGFMGVFVHNGMYDIRIMCGREKSNGLYTLYSMPLLACNAVALEHNGGYVVQTLCHELVLSKTIYDNLAIMNAGFKL